MNAEEKKALAATTLKALIENDAEKAAAGFADRISWWQPGEPASYGSPGRDTPNWIEKPKFIDDFITRSKQYAPAGGSSEINRTHCDGDTVIVEMTNRAKFVSGKLYENQYCFVCDLKAGKIASIRLFVDTQPAIDALTP
jgi:ketosteroid isomerase-like protein